MDKEIGRVKINKGTEIVVRITEYRGEKRIDIRKYITTQKYTGWSKQGISIPLSSWNDVHKLLEKV